MSASAAHPRDRMVASASAMLREHGVRGTSFGRVIEHSGAPRGSIAHHFPAGKRELIAAAVRSAGREIADLLRAAAARGATGAELVDAACTYFARGLERTDYRAGCPVAAVAYEAFDDPELRAAVVEAIDSWTAILAGVMGEERAQLSVATVEGAVMLARVRRSTVPLEVARTQLRKLLIDL